MMSLSGFVHRGDAAAALLVVRQSVLLPSRPLRRRPVYHKSGRSAQICLHRGQCSGGY